MPTTIPEAEAAQKKCPIFKCNCLTHGCMGWQKFHVEDMPTVDMGYCKAFETRMVHEEL